MAPLRPYYYDQTSTLPKVRDIVGASTRILASREEAENERLRAALSSVQSWDAVVTTAVTRGGWKSQNFGTPEHAST